MQQGLLDATMASVPADYLGRKMGFPVIVRFRRPVYLSFQRRNDSHQKDQREA
jgi:hypothetical protein